MQPGPLLTFQAFRRILEERCECRCVVMMTYEDGVLYAIERTRSGVSATGAVIHVAGDDAPIAATTIRSVCAALGLDDDLFGSAL